MPRTASSKGGQNQKRVSFGDCNITSKKSTKNTTQEAAEKKTEDAALTEKLINKKLKKMRRARKRVRKQLQKLQPGHFLPNGIIEVRSGFVMMALIFLTFFF